MATPVWRRKEYSELCLGTGAVRRVTHGIRTGAPCEDIRIHSQVALVGCDLVMQVNVWSAQSHRDDHVPFGTARIGGAGGITPPAMRSRQSAASYSRTEGSERTDHVATRGPGTRRSHAATELGNVPNASGISRVALLPS